MPAEVRAGVRLTPLKARIFDVVKRAGIDGIRLEDVNNIVFDGDAAPETIRSHVQQINELLAETDLQISGADPRGFYRIRMGAGGSPERKKP